ncbi:MAG: prolyl oligopeptidase family serine peptidase [Holophagaceae bacterium]|nr:prolyl oligopeptidase family serine peptidase [Holophagaceae bacterium]
MLGRGLVLVLCFTLSGAFARAGGPVTIGASHRLKSAILREDRAYKVHLPASYARSPDTRYPVLYLLDGDTHFLHATAAVDFLSQQGEVPEMIVVAIASTVRVRDFTQTDWPKAWVGGGGAGRFRDFLAKELIPEIERNHRASDYRVLSGHSAGGQFALYCLESQPTLFQAYFALAPSLDWDDELPLRSLEAFFATKPALQAFVFAARSDDQGRPLAEFERLQDLLTRKAPPGLRARCQAYPDETHMGVPLLGQIDALRALYAGWRVPEAVLDQGLAAVQAHYAAVSKRFGRPVAIPEAAVNELAYAALGQDRVQEAIMLFRKNVEEHPTSANTYDGLADGLTRDGQLRAAKEAADHAVRLARRFKDPNLREFERHAKKLDALLKAPKPAAK